MLPVLILILCMSGDCRQEIVVLPEPVVSAQECLAVAATVGGPWLKANPKGEILAFGCGGAANGKRSAKS